MNIFSPLDPAVKKLLGWKLGDEEDRWEQKAVEYLVKKMRKRKNHGYGTIEDLEYALAHPGSHSNCVTIPRSLDGRLQVSHRKGLPHVIFCRVWRWPNLSSHQELRPVPECLFPYDGRNEHICINPYHYQRMELPGVPGSRPKTTAPFLVSPMATSSSSSSSSSSSLGPPLLPPAHQQQQQSPQWGKQFQLSPSAFLSDDDDIGATVGHHQHISGTTLMALPTLSPQPQQAYWCSICYYELNSRVGEPFKVSSSTVTVDGFTNPSGEGRICLGQLSNVNRNITIENTRRHIGLGIRLSCSEAGVLLLNKSEFAVFVQSRNANFKYSLQPTAVCRVPSGATMQLFDYFLFGGMLEKAKGDGYQHVYELQKMCFVRLSFVKGWGVDYHRQDVTSTPCWLELQLHQPMTWIDSMLTQLDPPDHTGITSVS